MLQYKFPLYKLSPTGKIKEENNIIYIHMITGNVWIVDNRNLAGSSLAMRRINLAKHEEYKKEMYHFPKIILDIRELIKEGSGQYIDSNGELIKFSPTTFKNILYLPIKKRIYVEREGFYIEVDLYRESILLYPDQREVRDMDNLYAKVIILNNAPLLIELTKEKTQKRRKI